MTQKPKPRARRKKVALPFYTPVDGWEPDTRGMLETLDRLHRCFDTVRHVNPWDYWEAHRDEMI